MRIPKQNMICASIAAATAPALLLLGEGTAQAFNPQPDPPSITHQVGESGIGNPNDRVTLGGPDTKVNPPPELHPGDRALGGPDTTVGIGNPNDSAHVTGQSAGNPR